MFLSAHYSGDDLVPKFHDGEAWKKVFGPVFIYVNSTFDRTDPRILWEDAKLQVTIEIKYNYVYCVTLATDTQKTWITS